MYRRNILSHIIPRLSRDEIIILIWARQVGKTSLLEYIREEQFVDNPIEYYSLEDFEILELFDEHPKNLMKLLKEKYWEEGKACVMIDEIQYLKDPTNFLKYIYDLHKSHIKLIVTWSSPFYLDSKFKDSLAWRKQIFEIYPLSFDEFLYFKGEEQLSRTLQSYKDLTKISQDKLQDYLEEYILRWWYPKVVLEDSYEIKKKLL